jgi:hypothetical protein
MDEKFEISTDTARLDVEMIHRFLAEESYWARKPLARAKQRPRSRNSICFGVYQGERQVGFARVISDQATFAYLGDCFYSRRIPRSGGLAKS